LALQFLVLANGIIEGLPRGRSHLADQFTRASLSIVLNLPEGAGKHSKLDKRRYYLTARARLRSRPLCWMCACGSSYWMKPDTRRPRRCSCASLRLPRARARARLSILHKFQRLLLACRPASKPAS
jgi:hypothetical protein